MPDLLKKDFLAMLKPKNREIFTSVRVRHRNRSGVVDLVDREPLMFARVENGVTKSFQFFRRKNRKAQFCKVMNRFGFGLIG